MIRIEKDTEMSVGSISQIKQSEIQYIYFDLLNIYISVSALKCYPMKSVLIST